jgi:hypothetical protein
MPGIPSGPHDYDCTCARCEGRREIGRESAAREGLNIAAYPGKWQEAQRLAHNDNLSEDHRSLPYWERVRYIFQELGGQKL